MQRSFSTFLIYVLYTSLQCYKCCPPNGYTFCANQSYTCNGIGMVSYGNNGIYAYRSSSGSINCKNNQFGNPVSGTKTCCILSPSLPGPTGIIDNLVNTISCGDTVNGYLKDVNDIHYYKLITTLSNDTTYSLCNSGFDSSLTVYNDVATKISDPYCVPSTHGYGDDFGYCPEKTREIFTINNQSAGTYYIRVQYFYTDSTLGTHVYTLSVSCPPSYSIYDPFHSWTQINTPTMTMADKSSLMTGYDMNTNRIWLVGGDADETWYYDMDTNQFHNAGIILPVMDNLNSQSSTQMMDSIYFANNNRLRSFNMTSESISNLNSALKVGSINAPCLANDGRYIFVMGGEDESVTDDATNTFQIYDTITDIWYTANAMNQKRQHFSCNISPNKQYIYVFGGSYFDFDSLTQKIIQSAEKIDISNMLNVLSLSVHWDYIETFHMLSNPYLSRSIVDEVHGLMYTIGGRDLNGNGDDRIQIIDPQYDVSRLSKYTLNYGRSSPGVIMVQQIIAVFGGFTGSGTTNEMNTFEKSNKLIMPTYEPTTYPTVNPSTNPTMYPSNIPTMYPLTNYPSNIPSHIPTNIPTNTPTNIPTNNPITTNKPIETSLPTESPINEGIASAKTTNIMYSTNMEGFNNKNTSKNDNSGVIIGSVVGGLVLLCCIIILLLVIVYNQMKGRENHKTTTIQIQSESIATSPTVETGKPIHDINVQNEGVEMIHSGLPAMIPNVVMTPTTPGHDNEWSNDSNSDHNMNTKGNEIDINIDNNINNDDQCVVNEINSLETNNTLQ